MEEFENLKFDPTKQLDTSAVPDDTVTIIVKCGGHTYGQGVNMPGSQEATAKVVGIMMQRVLDTVDAKGLKAGGSLYDPANKAE